LFCLGKSVKLKHLEQALHQIDKTFLMYPPGNQIKIEGFLQAAKSKKEEN
jgi:hypothetical protein